MKETYKYNNVDIQYVQNIYIYVHICNCILWTLLFILIFYR